MADRKQRIGAAMAKLGRADQGRRVPQQLQQRVASYARARVAEGAMIHEVAQEVGVSGTSVRRWLAAYEKRPVAGFEVVEIVTDEAANESRRLIVHGPGGLVIEGLDLPQLADLLRRLG